VFACQGTARHETARERHGTARVPIRAGTTRVTYRVLKRGVTDFFHFRYGTTRTVKRSQHGTSRHETRHDTSTTRHDTCKHDTNRHEHARYGTDRHGRIWF
jgi:hypothetical protein